MLKEYSCMVTLESESAISSLLGAILKMLQKDYFFITWHKLLVFDKFDSCQRTDVFNHVLEIEIVMRTFAINKDTLLEKYIWI